MVNPANRSNRVADNHNIGEFFEPITRYVKPLEYSAGQVSDAAQRRFIVTGAPGAGKTTLLAKLAEKEGIACVSEAATDVIVAEQQLGDPEPWTRGGSFRNKIVALQEERQSNALESRARSVFFDRSPIDTMTFCLRFHADPTQESVRDAVNDVIRRSFYDRKVFLIQNLGSTETNSVRVEQQPEALLMEKLLAESYAALGFDVVLIPRFSLERDLSIALRRQAILHKTDS